LLLKEGRYVSKCGKLEWQLIEGDFAKKWDQNYPIPDFVFYDPFSVKTEDAPLWRSDFFEKLAKKWAEHPTVMVSYSNSTANRASWLAAGFFVASGVPSARRKDTSLILTQSAISRLPRSLSLLKRDWLDRWERSSAPAPGDILQGDRSRLADFSRRVREHSQFS
jgi:hypothetical protein